MRAVRTADAAAPGRNRTTTLPCAANPPAQEPGPRQSCGRGMSPWPGSRCPGTTTSIAAAVPPASRGDGAGTANVCRGSARRRSTAAARPRATACTAPIAPRAGNRRRGRSGRWLPGEGPREPWSRPAARMSPVRVAALHPSDPGRAGRSGPNRRTGRFGIRPAARSPRGIRRGARRWFRPAPAAIPKSGRCGSRRRAGGLDACGTRRGRQGAESQSRLWTFWGWPFEVSSSEFHCRSLSQRSTSWR
jgi:hypothetical protein